MLHKMHFTSPSSPYLQFLLHLLPDSQSYGIRDRVREHISDTFHLKCAIPLGKLPDETNVNLVHHDLADGLVENLEDDLNVERHCDKRSDEHSER